MRRVVVFGAARSGVAAANLLAARGLDVMLTDVRSSEELALGERVDPRVQRAFGGHPDDLLDRADTIVVSPGIPRTTPILQEAIRRGVPLISEVELAFRYLRGRVTAITGTNGKSTTTALIGEILDRAGRDPIVAGNIGVALTEQVSDTERDYVIELSSFQLETVETFRAQVALLLNITPDHLDRYGSMDEYAAAKYRIFRNQDESNFAIVNAEDPRTAHPDIPATVWRFSSARPVVPGAWLEGDRLVMDVGGGVTRIPRSALALEGTANVENALAAWLAARALRVPDDAVLEAFRSFRGLPHRMATIRELDGVTWINDSKGTNIEATLKSLQGLGDGSVILILGGKDKGDDFSRLADEVSRKARVVLTIGAASESIQRGLHNRVSIESCSTLDRAVARAHEIAKSGDRVLLSPACSSFDQFTSFEHRGDEFTKLVSALEARS